ncbi:hypothetical protein IAS59_004814 [Cryptococcus gattii]
MTHRSSILSFFFMLLHCIVFHAEYRYRPRAPGDAHQHLYLNPPATIIISHIILVWPYNKSQGSTHFPFYDPPLQSEVFPQSSPHL